MQIENRTRFLSAVHSSCQLKSAFRFKQGYKPGAHNRMIIHDQDSKRTPFNLLIHAAIASIFPFASLSTTMRTTEFGASLRAPLPTFRGPANCECENSRRRSLPVASYRERQIPHLHHAD